ncbi:hypothetical protein GEMRC1_004041 [Eukaryota sp. GEM-RC1]
MFVPGCNPQVLSCGNDNMVKLWDLTDSNPISAFSGHSSYVRSIDCSSVSSTVVSGSVDNTVCLWDPRESSAHPVKTFSFNDPVERVLFFSRGSSVAVAHGNSISLIDLVAGKVSLSSISHTHAISCLSWIDQDKRLLSGSLDGSLSIHLPSSLEITHRFSIPGPVTDARVNSDVSRLCIASRDGLLNLRQRKQPQAATEKANDVGSVFNLFEKNSHVIEVNDSTTQMAKFKPQSKSLQPYERALKGFNYSEALDSAFATNNPNVIYSLVSELRRRGALVQSIGGRSVDDIVLVVKGLTKLLTKQSYSDMAVEMLGIVVELYGPLFNANSELSNEVQKSKMIVEQLIGVSRRMVSVEAVIDTLLTNLS